MMKRHYETSPIFSQLFLVVAGVCFTVNLIVRGALQQHLALIPASILNDVEIWRLVTFPFSSPSIESFLLLVVSVGLFAPLLESALGSLRFTVASVMLLLIHGIAHTAIFGITQQQIMLSGADSLSFFTMALYTFVIPYRSIYLWKNVEIRGIHAVLAIVFCSFAVSCWRAQYNTDVFFTGAIASAFGVLFSVITVYVLNIKIHKSHTINRTDDTDKLWMGISDDRYEEEELVHTGGDASHHQRQQYPLPFQPELNDEEVLNLLLDKIYEHGQDSLSEHEKNFLEEYSKKLR